MQNRKNISIGIEHAHPLDHLFHRPIRRTLCKTLWATRSCNNRTPPIHPFCGIHSAHHPPVHALAAAAASTPLASRGLAAGATDPVAFCFQLQPSLFQNSTCSLSACPRVGFSWQVGCTRKWKLSVAHTTVVMLCPLAATLSTGPPVLGPLVHQRLLTIPLPRLLFTSLLPLLLPPAGTGGSVASYAS